MSHLRDLLGTPAISQNFSRIWGGREGGGKKRERKRREEKEQNEEGGVL